MSKSKQLEKKLNKIKKYEACWVFTRGHKFFIQDIATGNILKEFYDSQELDQFISMLEQPTMYDINID